MLKVQIGTVYGVLTVKSLCFLGNENESLEITKFMNYIASGVSKSFYITSNNFCMLNPNLGTIQCSKHNPCCFACHEFNHFTV